MYSSPVITENLDSSVYKTLLKMQENGIKHVVIVKDNIPVGIVTERDIARTLSKDKSSRTIDEISVSEVMSDPITISANENDFVNQSAVRMAAFNIGSVIAVDNEGQLVGIITKTDVARAFLNKNYGIIQAKDYMNNSLATCRKSDLIKFALNIINRNDRSQLVVTNHMGIPIGIITINTLLKQCSDLKKGKIRGHEYPFSPAMAEKLCVENLFDQDWPIVNSDEDMINVARAMLIKNVDSVPVTKKVSMVAVTDKEKNLVGTISKYDIVRAFVDLNRTRAK